MFQTTNQLSYFGTIGISKNQWTVPSGLSSTQLFTAWPKEFLEGKHVPSPSPIAPAIRRKLIRRRGKQPQLCGPRKRFKWLGFFVDAKKFSPVPRGLVSGLGKIPGFSWVFFAAPVMSSRCFALDCCAVSPWFCHCFTPNSVLWSQKGYNPGQVEPTFLSAVALAVAVFLEKCHKMSLSK